MSEQTKDEKDQEKITLPKELQKQMLEFFMKTSIPRIKKERLQREQEQTSGESK